MYGKRICLKLSLSNKKDPKLILKKCIYLLEKYMKILHQQDHIKLKYINRYKFYFIN